MTTKMYSYKRERAKRLYPEPAIFNAPRADMKNLNLLYVSEARRNLLSIERPVMYTWKLKSLHDLLHPSMPPTLDYSTLSIPSGDIYTYVHAECP